MDVSQLLNIVKEVDGDLVALVAPGDGNTVLRLHPARDAGTHRFHNNVNVGCASGLLIECPERSPGAARIIQVNRQLELDGAGLVDNRVDAPRYLPVHRSPEVPISIVELDNGAVIGTLNAVFA